MAELNRAERLQPSLLDRLTDAAPEHKREALDQQTLTTQQLKQAVLRDLGWLLNASNLQTIDPLPPDGLTARSTVNYGIAGIAGIGAGSNTAGLERMVADAIRAFEPRIRPETLRVHARPYDRSDGLPTLTLEISGEMWAQPVPQQLFLETSIELETRLAVVTEAKGRG